MIVCFVVLCWKCWIVVVGGVCLRFLIVGEFGFSVKFLLDELAVGWIVDSGTGVGLFTSRSWLCL